jgi:hypothetical protein
MPVGTLTPDIPANLSFKTLKVLTVQAKLRRDETSHTLSCVQVRASLSVPTHSDQPFRLIPISGSD